MFSPIVPGIDSTLVLLGVKYVKYGITVLLCLSGSDTDTVVGLPRPIHESIKTLKQVMEMTFIRLYYIWCYRLDRNTPSCHLISAQVRLHC